MSDVAVTVVSSLGTGASVIFVLWRMMRGLRADMTAALDQLRNNDLKHMEGRIDRSDQRLTAAIGGLRSEMLGLRTEIQETTGGLRSDVMEMAGGLRSEMRETADGLRSEMTAAVSDIRADMRSNQGQILELIRDKQAA